jgi:BolA protein
MTEYYAKAAMTRSSLDRTLFAETGMLRRLTATRQPLTSSAMQVKAQIADKLAAEFSPQRLDVVDESHQHEGHAGHRPGGQTHFRVYIVAEAFRGKSRIERHRMINRTLSGELAGGIHALAIHASAPGER